jgi:Uma2 family endonuclease
MIRQQDELFKRSHAMNAPNLALAATWEDRLADLGNISPSRILTSPPPGEATCDDLIRVHNEQGRLCELVDGTLLEKAMGFQEAFLAGVLLQWLNNFLDLHKLGIATGPDGMTRLFGDTVRGPDVAFIAWNRLPGGMIPKEPMPALVPNFVIEVLSVGNTYGEMSRKRREYFHAGVELLWMVDPRQRTIAVYRSSLDVQVFTEGEKLSGGSVLPGWEVDSGLLFGKLDQRDAAEAKQ